MAGTVEGYVELLEALLPPGIAWKSEDGTSMRDLLTAMADELARVDARSEALHDEADPRTTVELLADWERVAGLPDNCALGVQTLQERRAALVARMTARGGQSRIFFVQLAASLGFEVSITEYRPFRAGISRAGDALTNGDWIFTWRVNAPETTITSFRSGLSAVGEPLRKWGNAALECALERVAPAHTIVLFGYGADVAEASYSAADYLYFVTNYVMPGDLG